ncbi:alpha/beta fold hydrolase [Nocardioides humilatus]|uniref:Alpha/beta fold hydrolase n=1 Tax=Nocardioides humilatus TaxID=2607660 RepID=A0A5B1LKE3_9ACTN|nr:alpha/beta hydrolase [Nocardioides humilatus]KAA1420936.1 alpha/beta fold hydrolase [Nocardioides humilatus]
MTERRELSFTSKGVRCAAWHLPATSDSAAFGSPDGRPCVVMAHGFGGTRDTGLLGYAEGFAAAGLDVLLFDYRGFADSDGTPRQRVSYRRQRTDYHEAISAARQLDGVDPERIVLWGTSYSGGHIVPVAVADGRIAALLSLTPAMDGLAALLAVAKHHPITLARLVVHGVRDAARSVLGRKPHLLPVVGEPGSTAMITAPGALTGYTAVAGPTWRNEVCARAALEVSLNRPTRFATRLRTPLLVQIGERDGVAPPAAARRAAERAGTYAETLTYPVDHFDVYAGEWQQRALADQVDFLARTLAGAHSNNERQVG